MNSSVDAVVVGAGPNGLVAANLLADAGWDVLVLEAEDEPGGAVRSGEYVAPGFVNDRFSSFYPLGAASPALAALDLPAHGLRWTHAPTALAHPLPDGRTVVLNRDVDVTADSLGAFDRGDAAAWRALVDQWNELGPTLMDALLTPFPPVRAGAKLARQLKVHGALSFARFGLLSVRAYGRERFAGEGGPLLIAGNAMHTDLGPEEAGSAIFGWLLAMLGQDVGFPVPVGGAGELTAAMVRRLTSRGGRVRCGTRVEQVLVRDGRAVGVRADGETFTARTVLADVTAPDLYLHLLGPDQVPARLRDDLRRFSWDDATIKIDWALSGPIPWKNPEVVGAGTVHVGGDFDSLSEFAHELAMGRVPRDPFLLLGQMTTADPTRSPAGTESAWAYTHVPARPGGIDGWRDPDLQKRVLAAVDRRMEEYAPGFTDLVINRHVSFPPDLEAENANLVEGAISAGTSGLHQQLVLRPLPGLGRPETHIRGLYLASASAHPGGGVHGAPGANAAHAALRAGTSGRLATAVIRALASGRG
ncbi:NAD(P)/FAD-dependent oxidoreductase [Sporichthya brevicatena]|uniref:Pyridine nucleotide-disulfide oxidoreductase domain-containing protein 2 n=1 Tax=Sporichthya brevicatena TaxID=171442 RepID=A0ABN1HBC9_9ACTN